MEISALWKKRFLGYIKEISKYLKYMFNGHLIFALFFIFAGTAIYYEAWLSSLTADFPIGVFLGVIFGITLTISPTLTYLKEADKVFLIAAEERLSSYFTKSLFVSYIANAYVIFMAFVIFMPLITTIAGDTVNTTAIFIILLVVKLANQMIQFGNKFIRISIKYDKPLRFLLNFAVIYFIFEPDYKTFGYIAVVILVVLAVVMFSKIKTAPLPWIRLIDDDIAAMNRFYSFANLFLDVPHLRNKIRERKWFIKLLPKEKFEPTSAYEFLIARTFFRANDYFGLYVRLTVIGSVLLAACDLESWSIAVAAVFTYLTVFQILPILSHHEWHMMARIAPVDKTFKVKSTEKFLWRVINTQILIFGLISAIKEQSILLFLVITISSLLVAFALVKYTTKKLLRLSR